MLPNSPMIQADYTKIYRVSDLSWRGLPRGRQPLAREGEEEKRRDFCQHDHDYIYAFIYAYVSYER